MRPRLRPAPRRVPVSQPAHSRREERPPARVLPSCRKPPSGSPRQVRWRSGERDSVLASWMLLLSFAGFRTGRNLQHLARPDQIGIRDLVAVGLEDFTPAIRISE